MLPGTNIYNPPNDMSLRLGALSEPLTSCIRAFNRTMRAGGFTWSDTVVIQGSGPIGILAVTEEGVGRAVADAVAMKAVKSTIVPWPELVGWPAAALGKAPAQRDSDPDADYCR